jgi:hypothetical protein
MTRALYVLLIMALLAGGAYASRTKWAPLVVGGHVAILYATDTPADQVRVLEDSPGHDPVTSSSHHIPLCGTG